MNKVRAVSGDKQGECSVDFVKKQRFAAAILLFFIVQFSAAGSKSG